MTHLKPFRYRPELQALQTLPLVDQKYFALQCARKQVIYLEHTVRENLIVLATIQLEEEEEESTQKKKKKTTRTPKLYTTPLAMKETAQLIEREWNELQAVIEQYCGKHEVASLFDCPWEHLAAQLPRSLPRHIRLQLCYPGWGIFSTPALENITEVYWSQLPPELSVQKLSPAACLRSPHTPYRDMIFRTLTTAEKMIHRSVVAMWIKEWRSISLGIEVYSQKLHNKLEQFWQTTQKTAHTHYNLPLLPASNQVFTAEPSAFILDLEERLLHNAVDEEEIESVKTALEQEVAAGKHQLVELTRVLQRARLRLIHCSRLPPDVNYTFTTEMIQVIQGITQHPIEWLRLPTLIDTPEIQALQESSTTIHQFFDHFHPHAALLAQNAATEALHIAAQSYAIMQTSLLQLQLALELKELDDENDPRCSRVASQHPDTWRLVTQSLYDETNGIYKIMSTTTTQETRLAWLKEEEEQLRLVQTQLKQLQAQAADFTRLLRALDVHEIIEEVWCDRKLGEVLVQRPQMRLLQETMRQLSPKHGHYWRRCSAELHHITTYGALQKHFTLAPYSPQRQMFVLARQLNDVVTRYACDTYS